MAGADLRAAVVEKELVLRVVSVVAEVVLTEAASTDRGAPNFAARPSGVATAL